MGQARWTGVCLGGTKNPDGKIFLVSVYIFDGSVEIFLSVQKYKTICGTPFGGQKFFLKHKC